MECSVSVISSGRRGGNQNDCLFLFLLLVIFLLLFIIFLIATSIIGSLLLTLGGLWITILLSRTNAAPLGQLCLGPLVPFSKLFLPHSFQPLGTDDISSTLVELLSVAVGSGVRPPL